MPIKAAIAVCDESVKAICVNECTDEYDVCACACARACACVYVCEKESCL